MAEISAAEQTVEQTKKILALAEAEARANGILGDEETLGAEGSVVDAPPEEPVEEPKVENVAPEAALPAKGSPEDPTKAPPKEDAVQKRFDELTASNYALQRKIDALEARAAEKPPEGKKNPADEYTDEQLEGMILKFRNDEEHPEYAILAQRELNKRDNRREHDARDAKRQQDESVKEVKAQFNTLWTDLTTKHPDLTNHASELYKLANEEYQRIPEKKRREWPDEMEHAVGRAVARIAAQSNGKKTAEVARAAAAAKKGPVPLGGGSRTAATPNAAATLEKLHKAATDSGDSESPQWMAYLRAQAAAKKTPKED